MQMSKAFNRSVHLKQALSIKSNTGVFNTMRTIIRQDSFAGLWRGVLPTFMRNSLGVGVYFVTLNKLTNMVSSADGSLSNFSALTAGACARSFAVCLLCPLSVVKTRMETIEYSAKYKGVFHAITTIARQEGARGLFSGLTPAIVRDAPYSALYMLLYLRVKDRIGRTLGIKDNRSQISRRTAVAAGSERSAEDRTNSGTHVASNAPAMAPVSSPTGTPVQGLDSTRPKIDPSDKATLMGINFVSGAFGGGLATLLTQPQDVIKTRMQLSQQTYGQVSRYSTVREAARRIFNEEGLYGFFRGSSARILKRMLGSAITWMIFEETVVFYDRLLHSRREKKDLTAQQAPTA